jgi:hypothetical protein
MIRCQVMMTGPTVNIKKEHDAECRCIIVEIKTNHHDTVELQFESKDDLTAFHGLLGYALGITT